MPWAGRRSLARCRRTSSQGCVSGVFLERRRSVSFVSLSNSAVATSKVRTALRLTLDQASSTRAAGPCACGVRRTLRPDRPSRSGRHPARRGVMDISDPGRSAFIRRPSGGRTATYGRGREFRTAKSRDPSTCSRSSWPALRAARRCCRWVWYARKAASSLPAKNSVPLEAEEWTEMLDIAVAPWGEVPILRGSLYGNSVSPAFLEFGGIVSFVSNWVRLVEAARPLQQLKQIASTL